MKLIGFIFSVLLLAMGSCAIPRYIKKREKIVQETYAGDSIVLKDFIFCTDVVNSWGTVQDWSHPMDGDSILNLFKASLSKLTTNIKFKEDPRNYCDSTFKRFWRKPFKEEAIAKIKALASSPDEIQLIPLIKMTHEYRSGLYFTSGGAVGGSRYLFQNNLYLVIYLIHNHQIVYCRSALFLGEYYPGYDKQKIMHTLKEQDWDELVALTMKDYLVRIQTPSTVPN